MPKPASGHVRWVNGQAIARIRVTSDRREDFALPTCSTESEARERSQLLASVAKRLRSVQTDSDTKRRALEMVANTAKRSLHNALAVVEELLGGRLAPSAGMPAMPSFKTVASRWVDGSLARQYPDQIRAKRSADDDESRLRMYIFPVIGDLPINRVTLDAAEEVMRRLPVKLAVATRRNIGQLITRVMSMAVYPLRLIERSPIPSGFLPAAPKPKAMAYLYPSEDARLMACKAVPLEYRLLWGFLTREGMREGEALSLAWSDIDLDRGAIRLDRNKTDDPRAWALNAGVASALRRFRALYRSSATVDDRVFLDPQRRPISGSGALGLPALLRDHLRLVGIDRERPELFTSTQQRRRIRVHDLRGTFVTVSLANGRSESWISDRTGHRSSVMIARYKRTARTFDELQTGELASLDTAIPELIGHALATDSANYRKSMASPAGFEPASPT
jgi:integrase